MSVGIPNEFAPDRVLSFRKKMIGSKMVVQKISQVHIYPCSAANQSALKCSHCTSNTVHPRQES